MKAQDIMSRSLIIVNSDTSIKDVAKIMKENDIGFVPIAEDKKIVGVITDRDILINAIANSSDLNSPIKDYMTKNIIDVDINDNVSKILNKLRKNKVKRVLVSNDNKLVGIISFSDILNSNEFEIMNTMKEIWSIKRNSDYYKTEIDEFYL